MRRARELLLEVSKSLEKPPRNYLMSSKNDGHTSNGNLLARMRDRLIHHYFGVDYGLVWDTIMTDIPKLKEDISKIIKAEQNRGGDVQ